MASATLEQTKTISDTRDTLWYKDAIIYQLHVRSFCDSNGDGVGDFRGLTQKLDYIQDLGVTAIWLLPFFPSPLKDDGYDISDYTKINPTYGTLRDFKTFLREAHRRSIRVITELVTNHTSDQHEWFQRSRHAKPGTKWRNYYVWSDDPKQYAEARVIFQDFEASNWTWDPVAGAYFWHRFYHHQPDLNFDNPQVRADVIKLLDFWLDLGVDGVRLDAVPYLFEREGTNCENLQETHAYLKEVRAHVDRQHTDKMLLAEANQWPEDAVAYFGDGDECHMNFHFPLMPRLFMAVEREDRFPIIDILEQTPTVPGNSQWGIFLRNHDELTLEMVTDEERDYMYRAYAADPQARLNLGIRRRLAPLLRNNRRKIELMNGLLLSLPGTPILYYGDEIGMGDNIYLGDRDGVRTPMHWNADRNAGFSRANAQKLFLPVIIDSEYHFATRNVEIDENSPHSLLWWMRRIINLRKQFQAFGRGTFEVLMPDNSKVFAFLRRYEDETLLVVANLSRYAQYVELNLSEFRGQTPTELFGQAQFPPVGELPYFLTLGPHAFYWFRLQWRADEYVDHDAPELPSCRTDGDWEDVFTAGARTKLEAALAPYLRRHRWFAGKARKIQTIALLDVIKINPVGRHAAREKNDDGPHNNSRLAPMRLLLVRVNYTEGEPDTYAVPVVLADEELAGNILGDHPNAGILSIRFHGDLRQATLCEATWEHEFWRPLLDQIARRRTIKGRHGELIAAHTKAFRRLHGDGQLPPPVVHGGQQSNTSVVFGDQLILKLFRRLDRGHNPDLEIGKFLTERVPQPNVPDVAGAVEYRQEGGGPSMTLAILHEFRANEGDAWVYTLDELGRFIERIQSAGEYTPSAIEEHAGLLELAQREPPPLARETIGPYLQIAELLGQRTAALHVALGSREDADFATEPFSKLYQRGLYQSMRMQARKSLDLLRKQADNLPDSVRENAARVIQSEPQILHYFQEILERQMTARRLRCHGDFHLGQVLFTGKDFVIIDFEGEPDKPIGERRIKRSPLRDVAGMLRSLHYASHAALLGQTPGLLVFHDHLASPESWMHFWYLWSASSFLRAYLPAAEAGDFLPGETEELHTLLRAYMLEKALYELGYELNNRPDWVSIPLESILELLTDAAD